MDPTGGLTLSKQSLEIAKSVPVWLLFGLCSIIAGILWSPPFSEQLPASIQAALPLALFVSATLAIFKLLSIVIPRWIRDRHVSRAREIERFDKLYRPLSTLFLTCHVTTCTGSAAPRLRHRLANAWEESRAYRRRSTRLKRAWCALFDRQVSTSAEIEFGGNFPMKDSTHRPRQSKASERPSALAAESGRSLALRRAGPRAPDGRRVSAVLPY